LQKTTGYFLLRAARVTKQGLPCPYRSKRYATENPHKGPPAIFYLYFGLAL
jgi:hypothetical protein